MIKNLYAPWREGYIQEPSDVKGYEDGVCVFCLLAEQKEKDTEKYVIFRAPTALCFLNLYPYNIGHILVVPYRHIRDIRPLTEEEERDVSSLAKRSMSALELVLKPDGFNMGYNIGRAGGAGIPSHLHKHIIPRFFGDTTFLPIIDGTKVLSQSLEQVHAKLCSVF